MKLTSKLLLSVGAVLTTLPALAAGVLQGYPLLGGTSYCQVYQNGVCTQSVPAGPSVSGGEVVGPVDTGLANGAPPQSVAVPYAAMRASPQKNLARGGDFTTNLWQRGTTPLSTASPTTATMAADGWFAESAANAITVSKQTPAITAANFPGLAGYLEGGFYSSMRVLTTTFSSGSNCVGQVLDKNASAELIGKNAVLSFVGYAPSTFNSSGSIVSVSVAYYTATDSATAGTNTGTFGLSLSGQAGGIAGYTSAVAGFSGPTPSGASVASGVAAIPFTTTPTAYSVYAPIPATTAAGTQVIGVGFGFCTTPTATGSSNYFELAAVQLQAMPNVVGPLSPNGFVTNTPFERLPANEEARRELSYSWILTDGAGTYRYATGQATTNALAQFFVEFPSPMRIAPSTTVGTTISFAASKSDGTAQACGTSIGSVSTSTTTTGTTLLCTTGATALVAGNASFLMGANTGGIITFSAEP